MQKVHVSIGGQNPSAVGRAKYQGYGSFLLDVRHPAQQ
jgi:hypothetical protein